MQFKTIPKSVAILMKPDVRSIDYTSTAGTERVAINDMLILQKNGINTIFVSAAKIRNWDSSVKTFNLYFPQVFLDKLGHFIASPHNLIIYYLANMLYLTLTRLFEMLYTLQFIIMFRGYEAFYVFQVPTVGLLAPKKSLISFHGLNERTFYLESLWKPYLHNTLMVFCSEYLQQQFFRKTNISATLANSKVFHNVTSLPKNATIQKTNRQKIRYGFIGSWSIEKGICILRDTIIKLKSSRLPIEFYIAGSTDLWDQSKWAINDLQPVNESINKLKTFHNVKILGRIDYDQRDIFYKNLDFLIFPSIWQEPFAVVIIEAMSYGIPVISFNVGGVPEIIQNDANGYILNPPSVDILVNQIRKTTYIRNTIKYSQLKKNALKTIQTNFSDKTRFKKLSKLLFRGEIT